MIGWLGILLASTEAGAADPSAEYARQVSTAHVRLAQLEELLVAAELRIEQLEEVIRQQGHDEVSRLENIDEVNAEVYNLRGAIEKLQFDADELKRGFSDLLVESERRHLHAEIRLDQVEQFLKLPTPPVPNDDDIGIGGGRTPGGADSPGPARPSPLGSAPPSDIPGSAVGKLDLAMEHMRDGRQEVARAILRSALDQHPKASQRDEIQYRYAETFFNEQDYRTAISEFNKVVNNYPKSEWKCWSFFRMGESFELLGKPDSAKPFFRGATETDCRNTDAAKKAKERL